MDFYFDESTKFDSFGILAYLLNRSSLASWLESCPRVNGDMGR